MGEGQGWGRRLCLQGCESGRKGGTRQSTAERITGTENGITGSRDKQGARAKEGGIRV